MAIKPQDFWKNISVGGRGGRGISNEEISLPFSSIPSFPSVYKIGPAGSTIRSSSRKPTQPLARIPLINEEHCARPKFCERHTRVHRPREMGGRQGIVQWKGGRRGRKKRRGGGGRDRQRREDGSRRKPFDLSSRLSYCLSSFFHLC